MQRDLDLSRVDAHPAYLLEEVEGDPDTLILHLDANSTDSDEDEAYTEARRRLGMYALSYLGASGLYDIFQLTACVDYQRSSDFAHK